VTITAKPALDLVLGNWRWICACLSCALAGASLTSLFYFLFHKYLTKLEEIAMAGKKNVFVSILDGIGHGLYVLFSNPVAEKLEAAGLSAVGLAFPFLNPLTSKLATAFLNAQGQVSSQTPQIQGDTLTQVLALVVQDAEADLNAAGVTESAHQQAVVGAFAQFLALIPSAPAMAAPTAPAASAAAASSTAPAPATEVDAAPAVAVAAAPAAKLAAD
jgi:hypothetical protein